MYFYWKKVEVAKLKCEKKHSWILSQLQHCVLWAWSGEWHHIHSESALAVGRKTGICRLGFQTQSKHLNTLIFHNTMCHQFNELTTKKLQPIKHRRSKIILGKYTVYIHIYIYLNVHFLRLLIFSLGKVFVKLEICRNFAASIVNVHNIILLQKHIHSKPLLVN